MPVDNTSLENETIVGEQLADTPPTRVQGDAFSVDKTLTETPKMIATDIETFVTSDNVTTR